MASASNSSGNSKRSTGSEASDAECTESPCTQEGIKGKRLKKDDSGINVIQETESSDECSDLLGRDSEANKVFGQISPDSGNNEPCSFADLKQQDKDQPLPSASNNEAASHGNLQCSMNNISNITLEDINNSLDEMNNSMRLSQQSSSSDSDSDSSYDADAYDSNGEVDYTARKTKKKEQSDKNKKFDPTPNTPRPKHKWIAPLAVISRQYGYPLNSTPDSFRYNCYGSLHVVERLELMDKMKRHEGCVNALNFNSTGTKLASGSDDLDIVVWDWTIGEAIFDYHSGHRSNVFQAKFMPLSQDAFIVSCGRDGQVRLGEISSSAECKKTRKLAQHKGAAHKLAVQGDSPHYFFSCGEDAAVFGVDLRKEKPDKLLICKSKEKRVPLYSIFVNPVKTYEYVIGGKNQFVRVYDTRCIRENSGFLKELCPEHLIGSDEKNVTSVVYNYNGQEILASYNEEDIYSFDNQETDCTKYLHRYRGHKNSQTVKGVNYFGPKSEFIISGSDCGYIFFWEKESEHVVKYMYGDEGGVVNCLEPNPIMPVLATSGLDDDIKIWVPSCETPPDLTGLRKHLIANMREREEERSECPEAYLDQTIWFLMQHIARSRERRTSGREGLLGEEPEFDVVSSSDSDSSDENADDSADPFQRGIQCNQS